MTEIWNIENTIAIEIRALLTLTKNTYSLYSVAKAEGRTWKTIS